MTFDSDTNTLTATEKEYKELITVLTEFLKSGFIKTEYFDFNTPCILTFRKADDF